jgi:single-stranded-DNA-specific exonuclease
MRPFFYMSSITIRPVPTRARLMLEQAGVHPLLARLYAARGVEEPPALDMALSALPSPEALKGAAKAAVILADAIAAQERLLIVADYDCDGATACALALRALSRLGALVDFIAPNRFETGYGLSPEIVRLALQHPAGRPSILITVDNGISSIEGVSAANHSGLRCIITDHHLPGAALPDAQAIVNPNQPGCTFPSKVLAGVGVIFYVMLALRAELRRRGTWAQSPEPALADLLDLVALGTVADVVPLDRVNRILVTQGLARIRQGRAQPGIAALLQICGCDFAQASVFDLGFALGPRINAAGRLGDISLGIRALATDEGAQARNLAQTLDDANRERRSIEARMREAADEAVTAISVDDRASLVLFDPAWHEGIVGLIAGRLKEAHHRPVIACARSTTPGEIKGSGRAIQGVHLRDALAQIAQDNPRLLLRFGGHAAAAGLSLHETDLPELVARFEAEMSRRLTPAQLERRIETDGHLEPGYATLPVARLLRDAVWGQGFPPPIFADEFVLERQRIVGGKHAQLILRQGSSRIEAIYFNQTAPAPARCRAAYRLSINAYQGRETVQRVIEAWEPL